MGEHLSMFINALSQQGLVLENVNYLHLRAGGKHHLTDYNSIIRDHKEIFDFITAKEHVISGQREITFNLDTSTLEAYISVILHERETKIEYSCPQCILGFDIGQSHINALS